MKLFYGEEVAAEIITNHSMTIEEALYCHGYDIDDQVDMKKAYNDGVPGLYLDDSGYYHIDTDGILKVV